MPENNLISKDSREKIKKVILNFMDKIIDRRVYKEPFDIDDLWKKNPFGARLVPIAIWKGSKFERSFSTVQGQIGLEQIAVILAKQFHLDAKQEYTLGGEYSQGEDNEIHNILDELEHPLNDKKGNPDWKSEIKRIFAAKNEKIITRKVISDVWIKMEDKELFIELKSPKPNKDQCKVSKEKLFKIYCIKSRKKEPYEVYFALPYNPFGKKKTDYTKSKHPFSFIYFEMLNSEVVMIGKEFWDYIGKEGVFEELLDIFEEVGKITKKRIKEEYLSNKSIKIKKIDLFL